MSVLSIVLTLLVVVGTGYYVLKAYNPIFVLLFSGIVVLCGAFFLYGAEVPLPKNTPSQGVFLDVYKFLSATFAKTLSEVGLIIMSVAGFAAYMKHINASSKLAFVANAPLGKIKNKYLILSGTFVVGMMLKIVISSYAGLILLLLASIYPVLISLGIRPITAVSVLSLITLDYGPKDGNSINMAKMVGEPDNVIGLFLDYQLWSVVAYVVIIALVIPLYYAYVDKRDRANSSAENVEVAEITNPQCPLFYILLPWLPIVLLFGTYFAGIKLDVVSANFITISFCFLIEFIRHRDGKRVSEDIVVVLKAMAEIFVSVVSIIIAASVFAEGIKALGGLEVIVGYLASMGNVAVLLCIIVLSFLVFGITIIMGSGIAAFSAIGNIAANLAPKLGIKPIILVLPIEIASCLGRAASPIAGGILALAGFAKLEPLAIIKRTLPLLLLGMVINIVVAWSFVL